MPVVNGHPVLLHAYEHGYAVAAFNANTLEQMMAVVAAAEAERAPVFLQISQGTIGHLGLEVAARSARAVAQNATVPVVLHLDHGRSVEQLVAAIRAGLTSLMFDGSSLPLEENVTRTAEAARLAHAVGLPLEAELGHVPKDAQRLTTEQIEACMTNPEQVEAYVKRTGVDSLAVAVGSVHGMGEQAAELDLERLRAIRNRAQLPLVSHGTSGVRESSLQQALPLGLAKVNVATRLNHLFTEILSQHLTDHHEVRDPRPHLGAVRDHLTVKMREVIRSLGGADRVGPHGALM